jgi:hypothetical protein
VLQVVEGEDMLYDIHSEGFKDLRRV